MSANADDADGACSVPLLTTKLPISWNGRLDALIDVDAATQGGAIEDPERGAEGGPDGRRDGEAGERGAVERAIEAAKAKGAKRAMPLPVSAPFHSTLMKPAAEKLRGFLGSVSVSAPRIPVVNNVDVAIVAEPEKIRDSLVRQAASPVRWVETVRKMRDMGVTHVVECGPGKVLAGMTKRIAPELQSAALADRASLEEALKC